MNYLINELEEGTAIRTEKLQHYTLEYNVYCIRKNTNGCNYATNEIGDEEFATKEEATNRAKWYLQNWHKEFEGANFLRSLRIKEWFDTLIGLDWEYLHVYA